MTKAEKLQAIKDMGISFANDCPCDYGFFEAKICLAEYSCQDCWIETLEEGAAE